MSHRTRLLCLLLTFSTGIATADEVAPPDQVVRELIQALADSDGQRAAGLISPSNKSLIESVMDDVTTTCFEVPSVHVLGIEGGQDRTTVDVAAVITRRPRGKGSRPQDVERFRFELAREGGQWRIQAMPTAEELLIEEIRKNPQDAQKLIAAHPELIGPQLVYRMVTRATTFGASDYRKVQGELVDLAGHIAAAIDDRAGMALAVFGQLLHEDVPGADRPSRVARAEPAFRLAEESGVPEAIYLSGWTLATAYQQVDDSSRQSERVLRRLLEYRDSLRGANNAVLMTQLGQSLYFRQDYATAYQLFREALSLTKRATTIAQIELNLGWIMEEQNDPERAIEHFRRSAQAGGPKPFEIQALIGMARMHRASGRDSEAWELAQKALETSRATPFKGLTSAAYIALTEMQIVRGEMQGAEETLQKALVFARQAKAERSEMSALFTLGNLYLRTGRFGDALRVARQAEAVWRAFDFPGQERYMILMLAARSELALGREEEAAAAFGEAIAAVESVRDAVAGGVLERALFFEPFHAAYTEMVDLLLSRGRVAEALAYAERGKGRVLLDVLGQERKHADTMMSDADRTARAALLDDLGAINRKSIVLRATEGAQGLDIEGLAREQQRAQLAVNAFDADLAARHPRLRAARAEAGIVDAQSLHEIPPDLVFLEFVVLDQTTHLFVVGHSSVTHHRVDITRRALGARVNAFVRQLASRDLDTGATARALYDLLLGGVENGLSRKLVHCVVPDDVLWRLPFEALMTRDGRFLVERTALFYAPSISIHQEIVRAQNRRDRGEARLVAFGNPSLAGGARERLASVERNIVLGPLPDAEEEVRAIARLYGRRSAVYTREEAQEENAKREMSHARIVHFATHGLFDDRNPMFSQIVLASGGQEDGVLQAWEMMRLDLAVDLVVLSACDTARGEGRAGEGLIGMSWALFVGGCPSTVATLWRVDSRSASRLMVAFHRHLVRGAVRSRASKAEALRAAQLELLRDADTRHPFYWAGFVLIGSAW